MSLAPLALSLALAPQSLESFEGVDAPTRLVRIGPQVVFVSLEEFVSVPDYSLRSLAEGASATQVLDSEYTYFPFGAQVTEWKGLAVHLDRDRGPVSSDGTAAGTGPAGQFGDTVFPTSLNGLASLDVGLVFSARESNSDTVGLYRIPEPGAPLQFFDLGLADDLVREFFPLLGGGLFVLDTPANGREWWFTDGSPGGTARLTDIAPGAADGVGGTQPVSDGERIWFEGRGPSSGRELWVTDGTAAGTRLVLDLEPGPGDASPQALQRVGDRLLFRKASGAQAGVWSLDLATETATRLSGIGASAKPVATEGLADAPEVAFVVDRTPVPFSADLVFVWGTRGTDATTEQLPVDDIGTEFVQVASDGTFLFSGSDGVTGLELWRTDGTAAGTAPIPAADPGPGATGPLEILLAGDRILWRGRDAASDLTLIGFPVSDLALSSIHPAGEGCDSAPEFSGQGLPAPGAAIQFDLDGGSPGQLNALLLGRDLLPPPAQGLCGLSVDFQQLLGFVTLDGAGNGSLPVTVPADPTLAGRVFRLQSFGAETGGPLGGTLTASRPLEVFVGP